MQSERKQIPQVVENIERRRGGYDYAGTYREHFAPVRAPSGRAGRLVAVAHGAIRLGPTETAVGKRLGKVPA